MTPLERAAYPVGRVISCDYCNRDYSQSKAEGGFVFVGKLICPECAKRVLARTKRRRKGLISEVAEEGETFADFVRRRHAEDQLALSLYGLSQWRDHWPFEWYTPDILSAALLDDTEGNRHEIVQRIRDLFFDESPTLRIVVETKAPTRDEKCEKRVRDLQARLAAEKMPLPEFPRMELETLPLALPFELSADE